MASSFGVTSRASDWISVLDAGEQDAILLAEELHADQLIIDDRDARRLAERRGISVLGTLGVLRDAALLGLIDLRSALLRLQSTNLHIATEVIKALLAEIHH